MDEQSVKSDTDEETGETKEDEDRTHMDEESSENYEELQEEDNTPCQYIYYWTKFTKRWSLYVTLWTIKQGNLSNLAVGRRRP